MARNVLITGASRGIGKSIARAFASQGDDLVLTCLNNIEDLEKNAKELETKDYLLKLIRTEAFSEMKNPTDSVFFEDSEKSFYQAIIFNLDYYPSEYKKELNKVIQNYFSFFTKVIIEQNENILLILKTLVI